MASLLPTPKSGFGTGSEEQPPPPPQRIAEGRQEEVSEVATAGKTLLVTHLSVTQGVSRLSTSKHLEWGRGWGNFKGKEA